MVSIWANTPRGVRPGTPEFVIRLRQGEDRVGPWTEHAVLVDDDVVHHGPDYLDCHRWACNKWGLTSTEMLPVREDYDADLLARGLDDADPPQPEQAKPANRFRKQGA